MAKVKIEIVGVKIKEVRRMTPEEIFEQGWDGMRGVPPTVVVLENGIKLFPSRDPEGNGPGSLFGQDAKGNNFFA